MATADVPCLITSAHSSSERRITPSWTIAHLKGRLEPITGIPATCQRLNLKIASQDAVPIEASNEDAVQLASWPLQAYAEIHVGVLKLPLHSSIFAGFHLCSAVALRRNFRQF